MRATVQTASASMPQRRLAGSARGNTPGERRSKPRRVGVALGSASLWFGQLTRSASTTAMSFCSTTAISYSTLQRRRDGVVRSPLVTRSRSTFAARMRSVPSRRCKPTSPSSERFCGSKSGSSKPAGGTEGRSTGEHPCDRTGVPSVRVLWTS